MFPSADVTIPDVWIEPPDVDNVSFPAVFVIVYPFVLPIVTSTNVLDAAYSGANNPLAVATNFQVPPLIYGAPEREPDVRVNGVTPTPSLSRELVPIFVSIFETGAQKYVVVAVLSTNAD